MTPVRVFNDEGIARFREFLASGTEDSTRTSILQNEDLSSPFPGDFKVELRDFTTKRDAADYFVNLFGKPMGIERDVGLWAWLSLFFFDQICPAGSNGKRKVLKEYLYIPSRSWRHRSRHLLAGPYWIYALHGDNARIILGHKVYEHPDVAEQLATRQEIITNKGLIDVADVLYWDPERGFEKKGTTTRGKPGVLRRLIDISQQLDLTYDLYDMRADQLLPLLPKEFNRFRPKTTAP